MIAAETVFDSLDALIQHVWDPIAEVPWRFWQPDALRHYWLGDVLKDRGRVLYFLPLVLPLLMLRGDALKRAIVAAGLAFLAYNFGPLYALYWAALVVGFYYLSEWFAGEFKRTDVLPIGPPLGATVCVCLVPLITAGLELVRLQTDWAEWLHTRAWWLYPLGARGGGWEPSWFAADPTQTLFARGFDDLHLIGVAYFMVRMLHYLSEIKRETIPAEQRSLLNFVAYLCYAPSLMQGPIERYPRFREEIESCHQRRNAANLLAGVARIAIGLLKMLCVDWYMRPFKFHQLGDDGGGPMSYFAAPESIDSYLVVYLGVFALIFQLYLEFSGYCDMAIGMSRMFGYRLAENFQMPWISTSLRDFWRRWHITLSFCLRDYVYIAFGGNRRHVLLNLVLTFGVCGLWHAVILKMALWGMFMGLMVWANQQWVQWVKSRDEIGESRIARVRRAARRLRPLPTLLAWFVTMNAFTLSLLFFFGGLRGFHVLWELLRRPANAAFDAVGVGVTLPPLNAAWSA